MTVWKNLFAAFVLIAGSQYNLRINADVPSTNPAATTSGPAVAWNKVQSGPNSILFDFYQADKKIAPDPKGILHLNPAPFAIQFTGDVENTFVLASATDDIADALKKTNLPVAFVNGTGAAFQEGNLFIQSGAGLSPWDMPRKMIFENDEAGDKQATGLLKEELGNTPLVLSTPVQFVSAYAKEGAKEYRFPLKAVSLCKGTLWDSGDTSPKPQEWAATKHAMFIVGVSSPLKESLLARFGWRAVPIDFDAK